VLVLFVISAHVAVVATLLAVTARVTLHALLYLAVSLIAVAMVFYTLGAPFVAALEVIVYAGAIVVLFLFAVMLLGASGAAGVTRWLTPRNVFVVVAALLLLTLVGTVLFEEPIGGAVGSDTPEAIAAMGQVQAVGAVLFTRYVLVFELIGLLMLVGLVGALVLSQQWRPRKETQSPEKKQPGQAGD